LGIKVTSSDGHPHSQNQIAWSASYTFVKESTTWYLTALKAPASFSISCQGGKIDAFLLASPDAVTPVISQSPPMHNRAVNALSIHRNFFRFH